jgi:hypothetical protein
MTIGGPTAVTAVTSNMISGSAATLTIGFCLYRTKIKREGKSEQEVLTICVVRWHSTPRSHRLDRCFT